MPEITRRRFAQMASLTVAALAVGTRKANATPLGLPLGIQLYSVREQMKQDLESTLAAVREAGYVEVEAAALPKIPASQMRAALDKAGLRCVSAHHPFNDLHTRFDELLAYDKELGCSFMICSSPGHRENGGNAHGFSLDDWKYNAGQFNTWGQKTKAAGVRFGYHNHTPEFAMADGQVPYDVLLHGTDASLVTFEMDCGWVKVAGQDPVALMQKYPHRMSMLHVKDFTLPANPSPETREQAKGTELGRGTVDYRPIFAQAAKNQKIVHAFVEQEAFDVPWKESLKIDADYLRGFKA